jgi:hypothetical protein
MAQSIEQINQTILALEAQATDLGEQLYVAHRRHRGFLGQTAMQQLVMACFTLCTEAYPEEFLGLETHERRQVQAQVRQLAKQLQTDLVAKLTHPQDEPPPVLELPEPDSSNSPSSPSVRVFPIDLESLDLRAVERAIERTVDRGDQGEVEDEAEIELPDGMSVAELARINAEANSIEAELRALLSLESLLPDRESDRRPRNVVEKLFFWQENVESETIELMRQTSRDLNVFFQKAGLLPSQIPAPIIEAAAHTDGGDPFGKTPHLLKMVLEAREIHREGREGSSREGSSREGSSREGSKRDEGKRRRREDGRREDSRRRSSPTIVPIVAVQLRLVELEFNDANLISSRNQIRDILKQLQTVAKDYQKKQKEQAIANARLAWQSTWTND